MNAPPTGKNRSGDLGILRLGVPPPCEALAKPLRCLSRTQQQVETLRRCYGHGRSLRNAYDGRLHALDVAAGGALEQRVLLLCQQGTGLYMPDARHGGVFNQTQQQQRRQRRLRAKGAEV